MGQRLASRSQWRQRDDSEGSLAAIPHHWRHRLLTLQTTNHRRGIPTDHDAYMHAATYPEAITLAAEILNSGRFRTIEQDSLAKSPVPTTPKRR